MRARIWRASVLAVGRVDEVEAEVGVDIGVGTLSPTTAVPTAVLGGLVCAGAGARFGCTALVAVGAAVAGALIGIGVAGATDVGAAGVALHATSSMLAIALVKPA